ncbi:hypothetical protein [Enterococcus casseliflavus]|uniref:hypothetical protein n=1 Tax=Enterococcus casseliflavus TaxID=37734 RepID=UPI001E5D3B4F|nr:hypothetical protein [Enterococcus casseliflavus]MCD4961207.1 hypothetical protein [Enterococcus casseliflavus]
MFKNKKYVVIITYRNDWSKREYLTKYIDVIAKTKFKAIDVAMAIALKGTGVGDGIGYRSIDHVSCFKL